MFSRMDFLRFWKACKITPTRLAEVQHEANLIVKFKRLYDPVQAATKVPWYLVGCFDDREEGFRHNDYLGNGDPFNRPTVHVPRNRGPFKDWASAAIDSLREIHFDMLSPGHHWDIVTTLMQAERFNGPGYENMHPSHRSPYVWGATNQQQIGKYTSDGHFDPTAWDTQIGCAALLLALKQFHNVGLNEK